MENATIRSKFPKADRMIMALCGCYYKRSPIDIIQSLPPLFKFEEQFKDDKY